MFMVENKVFPDSRQIESASYNSDTKVLVVKFKVGGSMYAYTNVPPEKWEAMKKAESPGKFLNIEIKGKHAFTKLS